LQTHLGALDPLTGHRASVIQLSWLKLPGWTAEKWKMFLMEIAETPPRKQLIRMKKQIGFPSFWENKLSSLVILFLLTVYSAARSAEKHPSTLNI